MTLLEQCNLEPDIKLIKAILMESNYRASRKHYPPLLEGSFLAVLLNLASCQLEHSGSGLIKLPESPSNDVQAVRAINNK